MNTYLKLYWNTCLTKALYPVRIFFCILLCSTEVYTSVLQSNRSRGKSRIEY
uniref:Uncharacterized protein n=1 Tax=Octopus bimaculoides TaxID=37653 RepID=A0A0L8GA50_OCTBM